MENKQVCTYEYTWGDKHNHLVTCSYHTSLSFFIAGKGGETHGGQKRLAQQQVCAEIHIVVHDGITPLSLYLTLLFFYIMTHHIILCQCEEANCAHSFCKLISQDDPKYFKKVYLDKQTYPIRKCVECNQEFGTTLKVGNRTPVWTCVNAIKKDSTCVYAVCNNCIAVKHLEGSPAVKRARGRRKQEE
jgi:hypothetical protein